MIDSTILRLQKVQCPIFLSRRLWIVAFSVPVLVIPAHSALAATITTTAYDDTPMDFTWEFDWDKTLPLSGQTVPQPVGANEWNHDLILKDQQGPGIPAPNPIFNIRSWHIIPPPGHPEGPTLIGSHLFSLDSLGPIALTPVAPFEWELPSTADTLNPGGPPLLKLIGTHIHEHGLHRDTYKIYFSNKKSEPTAHIKLTGIHESLPVPEPSSLALLAFGGLLFTRRRRVH